ncbi:MAG: response regulator [Candidatus Omnitrophota bacterium]
MTKILVVDDEIDICDFVKMFFEQRKFQVFTALSGGDALRIVRKEKPGIILLDIRMKEMDGIETLKKIRATDKTAKVIMVTAVADQDKMNEACELGACEYITKPLVLEDLETKVLSLSKEAQNG